MLLPLAEFLVGPFRTVVIMWQSCDNHETGLQTHAQNTAMASLDKRLILCMEEHPRCGIQGNQITETAWQDKEHGDGLPGNWTSQVCCLCNSVAMSVDWFQPGNSHQILQNDTPIVWTKNITSHRTALRQVWMQLNTISPHCCTPPRCETFLAQLGVWAWALYHPDLPWKVVRYFLEMSISSILYHSMPPYPSPLKSTAPAHYQEFIQVGKTPARRVRFLGVCFIKSSVARFTSCLLTLW